MPRRDSKSAVVTTLRKPNLIARRLITWAIMFAVAFGFTIHYRHSAGPGYPLDDSYIHFAFARNLAEGNGFGINPNQPTPGATSPLWVILLSVGFLFGAGGDVWPWLIGAVILALCGVAATALCHTLTPLPLRNRTSLLLSILCGVVIASCFPLVWSAAGGMEAPLVGLTTLLALLALHRSRNGHWKYGALWGLCAGVAAAARPEGLLLIPLFFLLELLLGGENRIKRSGAGLGTGVVMLLPYMLFCTSTTGRWFPNTYYAKTESTRSHIPKFDAILELLRVAWQLSPEALLAIAIIVIATFVYWRKDKSLAAVLSGLGFALVLPISFASMERSYLFAGGAGNFGRYLFPMFSPLIALGFAALSRLISPMDGPKERVAKAVSIVAGLACVCISMNRSLVFEKHYYQHNVRDINEMQVRMADVLAKSLPSNSLVAANDVGALAFLTDHRVLDLVGIVSTDVLNVRRPIGKPAPSNEDTALLELLLTKRPTALVIFPDWYPSLYSRIRSGLDVIQEIYVEDNITSGGNRLVAYRVDWSRVDQNALQK
jgi:hypothetical protein